MRPAVSSRRILHPPKKALGSPASKFPAGTYRGSRRARANFHLKKTETAEKTVSHPRQVVPSDALDDEREERYRRTRIGAPARRQMGHCLAHETEADGGDETAQFHLQACWPRAGR